MLLALRLKNLAIIDSLELSFAPGLNVISGETGAGKSLIVGALALLLGGKASADLVRSGEEEAEVEALFEPAGCKFPEGLDLEDAEIILRRTLALKGRSRTWLNLRLCPAAVCAKLCSALVSICGQHEHQGLLNDPSLHLDILDRYGRLFAERERVAASFRALTASLRALEEARRAGASQAERAELLRFQVSEIEAAGLKIGEDEELEAERRVLRAAERLLGEAGQAYQLLYGEEGSAVARLDIAQHKLAELAGLDGRLQEVLRGLEAALLEAREAADGLRSYLQDLEPDPARLEAVEERLAAIRGLKRKYAATIEDVLAFREQALEELTSLEEADERAAALEVEAGRLRAECWRRSQELSRLRTEAAQRLSAALTAELRQVGMPAAEFRVRLLPRRSDGPQQAAADPLTAEGLRLSARGLETATFMVAPNPGEGLKPLARVASGGELSRVILGLKSVSSGCETLIFDEVDAGLGGAVAEVVGRKLKAISGDQQVICITHLPQIACYADCHFAVTKEVVGGRTLARVRQLLEAERLEEVARMLGGVHITEKARSHAREMIREAELGEYREPPDKSAWRETTT